MRRVMVWMWVAAALSLGLAGPARAAASELVPTRSLEVKAELDSSNESAAEAKENLAIQDQATQVNLVGQLEEGLDESYAGIWFDTEAGEFVVPVATVGDGKAVARATEGAVDAEFSSAALNGDYRTEAVRYSSEELEGAQERLDQDLARFLGEGTVQTAIDPEADAVEIRIADSLAPASRAEIETLARRSVVQTEFVRLDDAAFDAGPAACNEVRHSCDLPVRGGQSMYSFWTEPDGTVGSEGCTVGFRANGYNGRKYILTAGHCVHRDSDAHKETLLSWEAPDSAGNYHYVGQTNQARYPDRDWAKIDATGTWADTPPWPTQLVYWGSTDAYPVVGEARSYVGQTLCHVGMSSGTSCGIVKTEHLNGEIYGPGEIVNNLFEVEGQALSVIEGDSGGPIIANNIALGVASGCHCRWAGATLYFNDITEATAEMGLDIAGPGITEAITGSTLAPPTPTTATVSGQVDPHGVPTEYAVEYGIGSLLHSTAWESAGSSQGFFSVAVPLTGLETATTYQYRVVARNQYGTATGGVATFRTAATPPTVATSGMEALKKNSATLVAAVNPLGEPTTYQFEYGPTTAYGWTAPVAPEGIGSGRSAVTVRRAITGLKEGTSYYFRIRATNAGGTSYGSPLSFKTPDKPVVIAADPSYVNTLEPAMNATINPERAETRYWFEYGTTEAYGTKVPTTAESIGPASMVNVQRGVKGLQPNATYHYRVTAENEVGVVHGADRSFTTLPPCKGAEAKCLWSLQETSNPLPPSKFEMKSVSCASATSCVAVGKDLYNGRTFVDRWNGTAWSRISGSVAGEMRHVACLAGGCMAVGVSGGAAATWSVAEYPVGKGNWAVTPLTTPLPSGASETVLRGVACSGESACTAVGSYKGSDGIYHPLVERWNGSSWAPQSAPNPVEGTAQNAMLSVSCISLGCITVGEAAGKPTAETWVNGTWALSATKLPAGAKGGRLSSVSCTGTSCVAVGQSNEGAGTERALAENMVNLVWSLMSAPSPAEAKGFVELAGVSCVSASACTAAGYYASAVTGGAPTELKTLAEAWNGTSWTIQSSPNAAGRRYNTIADVSCGAAGACTAVGADSAAALGALPETLAERWNGSTWATQALVDPEEPVEAELKSVSCASNTLCVGVGEDLFGEAGFAEVWNGTGWSVAASIAGEARKISCASAESCFAVGAAGGSAKVWLVVRSAGVWGVQTTTIPLPVGSTESTLAGVSCAPGGAVCTAVGSYKGSDGVYHPLVERWNGSAWALQSAPNPAEGSAQNAMLGVACPDTGNCVAVGEAAAKPVVEVYAGGVWSSSPAPALPAGAKGGTFAAVSCGASKACVAVGDSYETAAGSEKALAARWNGSTWSVVATPAPAGAKGFVNLTDVACLSPNACFAAGSYAPEVGAGAPVSLRSLAESWDGTAWSVLASPDLGGQTFDSLAGISCSTAIDCTAVGGTTSSLTKRPPVQLAMRFE